MMSTTTAMGPVFGLWVTMSLSKDVITRGLKDVEDPDKDVRYMAISDLATELGKDAKIDPPTQRRLGVRS